MIHFGVNDVRTIELPCHLRADGEVVVAEASAHVPFAIARVFTISSHAGARRGEHAHRQCSQLMLCVHGAVDVISDDGRDRRTIALERSNVALLVPPTIWNTVVVRQPESVLMVLCDRSFEEEDYIREYSDFLAFRKALDP